MTLVVETHRRCGQPEDCRSSGACATRLPPRASARRAACASGSGAHVGTRLLNAHAISLAAALPPVDYACEVGEFMRMYDDPFAGIEVVNGAIAIPDRIGCGVEPVGIERALAGAA